MNMLDETLQSQKIGEARGITSVCSTHPWVLKAAMRQSAGNLLIEATCNQVNQFGGYTGMKPSDFVRYAREIAEANRFPVANLILGGDHLGPHTWQGEPVDSAMEKAEVLIRDYVQAGFTKLHLDCSMRLGDDPGGVLDVVIAANRAARLAKVAEASMVEGNSLPRYVIGTEVPIPGGTLEAKEAGGVTSVEDARQSLEATKEAFYREGLRSAWERVIALVVQPGVEFGDEFVQPYEADRARALSQFIESQSIVYEAHSTDYQSRDALKSLVRDHFAILKVGPALTFAFREAVFALTMIENELVPEDQRSNLIRVVDDVMVKHPKHWKQYYRGDEKEQALKRKYSLSDRVRYYWVQPEVQDAILRLLRNLGESQLPYSLLSQYVGRTNLSAVQVIEWKVSRILKDYSTACNSL